MPFHVRQTVTRRTGWDVLLETTAKSPFNLCQRSADICQTLSPAVTCMSFSHIFFTRTPQKIRRRQSKANVVGVIDQPEESFRQFDNCYRKSTSLSAVWLQSMSTEIGFFAGWPKHLLRKHAECTYSFPHGQWQYSSNTHLRATSGFYAAAEAYLLSRS